MSWVLFFQLVILLIVVTVLAAVLLMALQTNRTDGQIRRDKEARGWTRP